MVARNPPSEPATYAKRKIRNFLIDRRFQLGWVARVAFTTAVILGVMGFFLYRTLNESTEMMIAQTLAVDGLTPDAQQRIIEQGEHDELVAVAALGTGLVALLVLLSLMTIIATHKIAGPAVKMRKILKSIDGDNLQLWEKLRKGDELHETFHEIEEMSRRLREARHREIEEISTIANELRNRGDVGGAAARLESLASRYRDSIEMR